MQSQKFDNTWIVGYDGDNTPYRPWGTSNIIFTNGKIDTQYIPRSVSFGYTCMTVSDPQTGSLLLYSNGCDIYDGNDNKIGSNINPGKLHDDYCEYTGYPLTKGGCFLMHPGNPNKYYLLHRAFTNINGIEYVTKLYYTEIIKENFHWRVVRKNKLLSDIPMFWPDFNVVKHANGRDWWIIFTNLESQKIYRFMLTNEGFMGPFIQKLSIPLHSEPSAANSIITPDGKRFIRIDTRAGLSILDFKRSNGEFCNLINLPFWIQSNDSIKKIYVVGTSVSPNSQYLYVSTSRQLWQLDLDSKDISSSLILIGEYDGFKSKFGTTFFLHGLAPDNKIYLNCTTSDNYFHVIDQPNLPGKNCNFIQHAIKLPTYNSFTMPYFPNYRLGVLENNNNLHDSLRASVFPNPASHSLILQNFHDGLKRIHNSLGQLIIETIESQINISFLANGVYLISGTDLACNPITLKFVKE